MNSQRISHKANQTHSVPISATVLLCFCGLFLIMGIRPAQALDITFRSTAVITGATITLADIADINSQSQLATALKAHIVGPSPNAGKKISLDSGEISRKILTTLDLSEEITWKGATEINVERKAEIVTSAEILKRINQYLQDHANQLPQATITFTPQEPPLPFTAPTGELKWEIIPSNPDLIGSNRFSLIVSIGNDVIKNFSVKGKLEVMAPVAVASSNLQHGNIIDESLFQMEPRDLSELRSPCLLADQVVGKKLLRSIKAGSVIEIGSLEMPPLVKKGTLVKIVARKNGMELTATGIAKTDGKEGQVIKIINASSEKEIFCRVLASGLVEVQI